MKAINFFKRMIYGGFGLREALIITVLMLVAGTLANYLILFILSSLRP